MGTSYDIYMAEINRLKPRKRKQWKTYLYDKWGVRTRCKYEGGKIMNWSLLENAWVGTRDVLVHVGLATRPPQLRRRAGTLGDCPPPY